MAQAGKQLWPHTGDFLPGLSLLLRNSEALQANNPSAAGSSTTHELADFGKVC